MVYLPPDIKITRQAWIKIRGYKVIIGFWVKIWVVLCSTGQIRKEMSDPGQRSLCPTDQDQGVDPG